MWTRAIAAVLLVAAGALSAWSLTNARSALAEHLPGFLGAKESRRYLIGAQNPAELRGTGGLIGAIGELTVHDGAARRRDRGLRHPGQYALLNDRPDRKELLGDVAESALQAFLDGTGSRAGRPRCSVTPPPTAVCGCTPPTTPNGPPSPPPASTGRWPSRTATTSP